MTLAFKTHFEDGRRTNFLERIRRNLYGLYRNDKEIIQGLHDTFPRTEKIYRIVDAMTDKTMKYHTIREDKSNRWKAGNDIHFVINNRTPERFQFAPVVKCMSVQKIEILKGYVFVDSMFIHHSKLEDLIKNDGFESVEQFFAWFNTDFTGKIIHWTDLKY